MKTPERKKTLAMAIFLVWLLPALACNFPPLASKMPGVSAEISRQTLAVQLTAIAEGATPPPDFTPPPPELTPPPPQAEPPSASTPVGSLRTATPGEGSQRPGEQSAALSFIYFVQSGDTLPALAGRFGVDPIYITSPQGIPPEAYVSGAFLPPGQELYIPNVLGEIPYPSALLPDSEVIYSPSTVGFSVPEFIALAGGYLSTYGELVDGEWFSGADILQRVASETSANPRFLLAILEYRSGWVYGQPAYPQAVSHPIGFNVPDYRGLYKELVLTANHLNIGYYRWRQGTMTDLKFADGTAVRFSPDLNPGTVAVQHLFARLYRQASWIEALHGPDNFLSVHARMFGDPWARAAQVEPLFPAGLTQVELELPFPRGEQWSYTGGPHQSWNSGSPAGAVDFAPVTGEPVCAVSRAWVTASAPGIVTRSSHSVVAVDLDGDGYEQTGWVLVYLHLPQDGRVPAGAWVNTDDPLGHPSCERGENTGTHVHLARKYNGEWVPAEGPLPFILSGWKVNAGSRPYEGTLTKGDQVITASPGGSRGSTIIR
jgi:LasA protease